MDSQERKNPALKQLWEAKGDIFEAILVERLVQEGNTEVYARSLARRCSNQVWRNASISGGAVQLILRTPVGTAVAGAAGALVAFQTFLHSEACASITPANTHQLLKELEAEGQ